MAKIGKTNIRGETMILVFLLISIFILNILVYFTHIKFNLKRLYITNIQKYNYYFDLNIEFFLFNKIKIGKINLNEKSLKENELIKKIGRRFQFKPENIDFSKSKLVMKKLGLKLEKFESNLLIGTENAATTAFFCAIISSAIGITLGRIIKKYNKEKYKYIITPCFENKNIFELLVNCIISVKLVHIIYVIFIFSKQRSEKKYERTSNRRSYDYSYE